MASKSLSPQWEASLSNVLPNPFWTELALALCNGVCNLIAAQYKLVTNALHLPQCGKVGSMNTTTEVPMSAPKKRQKNTTTATNTSDAAQAAKAAHAASAASANAANAAAAAANTANAQTEPKKRTAREYILGEEIANSVTHGIGALLAIAALVILIVLAVQRGGGIYLLAALVYGITMLLEYLMSTMYHALAVEKAKKVFKVLDHSFIYLFIAGSYTPFCLITLANNGGFWLAAVVWALALAGVACEAFWVFRPRWISAVLYLLIGWCVVWFLPALVSLLPAGGFWLLLAGGFCYTIGCIFYILKKVPYMHSVFHLFVLAGTVCQFLAVALYVM